jgi:hypothetical protein
MKPGLLGVYVTLFREHATEKGMATAAESLRQEYPGYDISVLCLPTDLDTYMLQQTAMEESRFEIMVVKGARLSPELYNLFKAVPPDVEVVNETLCGSDLDYELHERFRSRNRDALKYVREMTQATA